MTAGPPALNFGGACPSNLNRSAAQPNVVSRWHSPKVGGWGAGLVFVLLSLLGTTRISAQTKPTIVGSKKFTESYVLGEIAKKLLVDNGVPAEHKQGMGATIILWQALTSGAIDLYPEYTGTISEEILKSKEPLTLDSMRSVL